MKRTSFKAGLFFGIIMAVFFILKDLWTAENYTAETLIRIIAVGLISGIIAAILFGYGISKIAPKLANSISKLETEADEKLLLNSPANHYKKLEAVGGKLFLTNKRLVFKSHNSNIQNHEIHIALNDIVKIERFKNFKITNNGVSVLCRNGKIEKFVVEKPEEWIERINTVIL